MNLWNQSPLDQFIIRDLINIKGEILNNINISLTNIGLYISITTFLILMMFLLSTNYNIVTPNNWSLSIESIYLTVYSNPTHMREKIYVSEIEMNK